MAAFWLSLGVVLLAELGDKTQLVALCFATRYRAGTVLAGVFAATFVVHLFSVALGSGAGAVMPRAYVSVVAGLAFLGFGWWTLQGDNLDEESCNRKRAGSAFWIVASTFFLAELGDKTMLSTVTLATDMSWVPIWIGSSLGMVVSDGLAIGVGKLLGASLPERAVKIAAAAIFWGFGAWKCVNGVVQDSRTAWLIPTALLVVTAYAAIRQRLENRASGTSPTSRAS